MAKQTSDVGRRLAGDVAQMAEAVMLLCASLVCWLFTAIYGDIGYSLLVLGELSLARARVCILLAALSLIGILVSCSVAAHRSCRLGVVLCAVLLAAYTALLSDAGGVLSSLVPGKARGPRTVLTFDLTTCDLQGAELYVNGAPLGTLPLTMDEADFVSKVPVWDEAPARIELSDVPEPLRQYRASGGMGFRARSLYKGFDLSHGLDNQYYAQVKYHGQWCYATGGGGGGSSGVHYVRKHIDLEFVSVESEQRLKQLLNHARVKEYDVSESWFDAMEILGGDAVRALLKAEPNEPGFKSLLDQWASRKFSLDSVEDEATAWQAFEDLCQTATQAKAYSTEGLEGRAVALLAPKLNVAQLTREAIRLLRATDFVGWITWQANGKRHFGVKYHDARYACSTQRMSYYMDDSKGQLPVNGYAVAHALWVRFRGGDTSVTRILQEQIVPEILIKCYRDPSRYSFLSTIGGPLFERYLLRQNWQAEPKPGDGIPSGPMFSGHELNGWLFMLANLRTPTGVQFRKTHRERLFHVADQADLQIHPNAIDLLFLNLNQGTDSLAYQYWPRFFDQVIGGESRQGMSLEVLFKYLLKLEPVSHPRMYVEAFQAARLDETDIRICLGELSKLPPSKKRSVYSALREAMMQDISHVQGVTGRDQVAVQRDLLSALERTLASNQEKAEKLYQTLASERSRHHIAKWLRQVDEDHAIVPLLARSDQAELRRLALYAIESFPSVTHRALLEPLLADTDLQVRGAAAAVRKNLDDLVSTSLDTLKAD